MTDIVVFSDDSFYTYGITNFLKNLGVNVFVCNDLQCIPSIPSDPVMLYIVVVEEKNS